MKHISRRLSISMVLALFIASCQEYGASESLSENLRLRSEFNGDAISIFVENKSSADVLISSPFAMASGGNITSVLIDQNAILRMPCVSRDSLASGSEMVSIPQMGSIKIWAGTLSSISRQHCLAPGVYFIHFAYEWRRGSLILSRPVIIDVSEDFSPDPL